MKGYRFLSFFLLLLLASQPIFLGCSKTPEKKVPVIGFMQALDDETIAQAQKGFISALAAKGYSDSAGTVKIMVQNAQNDQIILSQIADQFIAQKVTLIAANTTLAMMMSVNKTKEIPIFVMVAPEPKLAEVMVKDASGKLVPPSNLKGVYETLFYIDSTMHIVKQVFPKVKKIGTIFNTGEINSENSVRQLRLVCQQMGITLVEQAITTSNESQQAAQALLKEKIELFFALPDNLVFASFESILKEATEKNVPVVTSEEGLVKRGAYLAYGADFYQWGYQTGEEAALFLDSGMLEASKLTTVKVRRLSVNKETAQKLNLPVPAEATIVP
ncbi:MAG: ABC transporter substrate-binding protein [Chloroherpetonaceae bacterium]|nr:ABC transporter substrate-binding protein [Chloroherpetonaceae bacterium]